MASGWPDRQEYFISSASFQHLHAAFQNPQIHFWDDLTNYKEEKVFKRELKTFEAFDRLLKFHKTQHLLQASKIFLLQYRAHYWIFLQELTLKTNCANV